MSNNNMLISQNRKNKNQKKMTIFKVLTLSQHPKTTLLDSVKMFRG